MWTRVNLPSLSCFWQEYFIMTGKKKLRLFLYHLPSPTNFCHLLTPQNTVVWIHDLFYTQELFVLFPIWATRNKASLSVFCIKIYSVWLIFALVILISQCLINSLYLHSKTQGIREVDFLFSQNWSLLQNLIQLYTINKESHCFHWICDKYTQISLQRINISIY